MKHLGDISAEDLLNSLYDGIYTCDLDRRITLWSDSAARITGWQSTDVLGKRCCDNVLCHVDKDGHQLCYSEYCPLQRAMVTGKPSRDSVLIYALGANKHRIPVQVMVAPIRNASDEIIGGLETFRDAASIVVDLERAKAIQQMAMKQEVPEDGPLAFNTYYISHDIVGGDYYAIKRLGEGRYGLMLADVTGHGVAPSLYTMHLGALWNQYHPLLRDPVAFAVRVNKEVAVVARDDKSFATAICGVLDLNENVFRFTSAGGPGPMVMRADGRCERVESAGFPLGLLAKPDYEEISVEVCPGDRLLLFTDGAVEIHSPNGQMLGADGLIGMLRKRGYPQNCIELEELHEDLLMYSNSIRLNDDLAIIEVRFEEAESVEGLDSVKLSRSKHRGNHT
jgi:phosphoserine phosphatase RsbU/P